MRDPVLIKTREGIYCPAGDFHNDPKVNLPDFAGGYIFIPQIQPATQTSPSPIKR